MKNVLMILLILMLSLAGVGCAQDEVSITTVKEADGGSTESSAETSTETSTEASSETSVESADKGSGKDNAETSDEADTKSSEANAAEKPDKVYVYICGAVAAEGVYELPGDSRVQDVLDKAGGYSENACRGYVNLAEKLQDGQRIYIPYEEDMDDPSALMMDASNVDTNSDQKADNDNTPSDKVNINTADKSLLMTLPGIGEGKASDIIEYRESHGGFTDVKDITNVSGIGESTFAKLKDKITVN